MLIFINSDPEETRTLDLRRDRAALQPTEPPGQIKVCTFKTTYMLHPCGIFVKNLFQNLAIVGQALTLLVTVSSMHYCTSTSALSTSSSSRGFTSLRMGYLILRGASRLDAFSVYPFRTWLPGRRLGSLTGTPAVRPSRSSRTKDSSSQISYAHAG